MKTLKEAIEDLQDLATEKKPDFREETTETLYEVRSDSAEDLIETITELQNKTISLHVLIEALADLGAVLGVWNSDMIRIACENVDKFDRIPGDTQMVITDRQKELSRILANKNMQPNRVIHKHF